CYSVHPDHTRQRPHLAPFPTRRSSDLFTGVDDLGLWLKTFYTELHHLLEGSVKVVVHNENVDDRLVGIMGGYIRWSGLVEDPSQDRKSTRLNSSHVKISYAVFCLKKKK